MSGSIAVLREILGVSQDDPSSQRRWFHDDDFDLFVREKGGELAAFELCYGIDANEQALVWIRGQGYFHDGELSGSGDFIGARLASGDPLEARLREYALQNAEGSARRARFRRAAWQRIGGEQKATNSAT